MTQSLSRRSFVFLEVRSAPSSFSSSRSISMPDAQLLTSSLTVQDYLRDKPDTDLNIFPPTREIHIPNECASLSPS